jgi:hypothetical protein
MRALRNDSEGGAYRNKRLKKINERDKEIFFSAGWVCRCFDGQRLPSLYIERYRYQQRR